MISLVEVLTAFAFAVAFDIDLWAVAWPLAGVVLLATFGLCCAGTLFSAMSVRTRLREVLLPILLLPALFPVLAGAVAATRDLIVTGEASFEAIQLLLVIDGVYLVVSFLGFEYILDE